jgi:hypothetical protein
MLREEALALRKAARGSVNDASPLRGHCRARMRRTR